MSTIDTPAQGYHIHRRVSFGLGALSEEEKRTIRDVLSSRDRLVASTADPGRVRRVSRSEPIYALSILSDVNIIYKVSGGEIEVPHLMSEPLMRQFAPKRKSDATKNSNGAKGSN